ncbi:MAG TPA: hypothetical protein VFC78_08975, partial [Tepidisphaeraceae bacterium]|nr:hypothetical protein [Tepidisphaeraceae bacterium]
GLAATGAMDVDDDADAGVGATAVLLLVLNNPMTAYSVTFPPAREALAKPFPTSFPNPPICAFSHGTPWRV